MVILISLTRLSASDLHFLLDFFNSFFFHSVLVDIFLLPIFACFFFLFHYFVCFLFVFLISFSFVFSFEFLSVLIFFFSYFNVVFCFVIPLNLFVSIFFFFYPLVIFFSRFCHPMSFVYLIRASVEFLFHHPVVFFSLLYFFCPSVGYDLAPFSLLLSQSYIHVCVFSFLIIISLLCC